MRKITRHKRIIGERAEDEARRGFPEQMGRRAFVTRMENMMRFANQCEPSTRFQLHRIPAKRSDKPILRMVDHRIKGET